MNLFGTIALFAWLPISVISFFRLKAHHAVLFTVIGGWLFLPMGGYNLPGLPEYSKSTSIVLGMIIGGLLSGQRKANPFNFKAYDLPMLFFCLSPIPSALSNHLGLYEGLSGAFLNFINFGGVYFAGRRYFTNLAQLEELAMGMLISGLIYVPLCLYEIRMSPQLSYTLYGLFPHQFAQHVRSGGFRPIVFLQHGLMVSLWMAATTSAGLWLWRLKKVDRILGLPMLWWFIILTITTILCKSVNGIFALLLGTGSYLVFKTGKAYLPFRFLIIGTFSYLLLRSIDLPPIDSILDLVRHFVDSERLDSLQIRLYQEHMFNINALKKPIFGWSNIAHAWPVDISTGYGAVDMIDAIWLIIFCKYGYFGLLSLYSTFLYGPWVAFNHCTKKMKRMQEWPYATPMLLGVIVVMFTIDTLVNGMLNLIYLLVIGALCGWHGAMKEIAVPAKPLYSPTL